VFDVYYPISINLLIPVDISHLNFVKHRMTHPF